MLFKKISCFLCVLLLVICTFTVTVLAARTGEFETYDVEFNAITPDVFSLPVEIVLTHKTEKYVLKYYLYAINNYFLNEPVYPGEYDVQININGAEEGEFGLIYDKNLVVETSNLATSYLIIIDPANTEGDYSGEVVINESIVAETSSENSSSPTSSTEINTPVSSKTEIREQGFSKTTFILLLATALTIAVIGVSVWAWKKYK